jgi:site-specific DNA recombinase
MWDQLFPAEQARILQLLVARVVVRLDDLEISLRAERDRQSGGRTPAS